MLQMLEFIHEDTDLHGATGYALATFQAAMSFSISGMTTCRAIILRDKCSRLLCENAGSTMVHGRLSYARRLLS